MASARPQVCALALASVSMSVHVRVSVRVRMSVRVRVSVRVSVKRDQRAGKQVHFMLVCHEMRGRQKRRRCRHRSSAPNPRRSKEQ